MKTLRRLVWLIPLLSAVHCGIVPMGARPRKVATELLLPLNSTTALMCEPVFSGDVGKAVWFRDGKPVASVTSESNAVFENRPHISEQPMPNVGFLVISNIAKEDEGEYWCRKEETGDAGEVFHLKVAFVEPIPKSKTISVEPSFPSLGAPLMAHCPVTPAFPKPSISWALEGEPLSASMSDSVVFANGSLFLPRLSSLHIGKLECTVSNFAGKTSTYIQLRASHVLAETSPVLVSSKCSVLFRSSILWFLLGCLVTSSAVLLYLLCVLVFLRPNQPRLTLRPSMWLRSNPLLGPGFRKAIVPTPDFLVPRPPQDSESLSVSN